MVPTINLLPPELLSEILQRVEQVPKACLNQHVRFLSHVDRHWRTIALDTPLLWTTIVTKTSFDAVHDFERITVWLRRSKTLPINFVLRDIEKGADRALLDILKAIGPTLETLFFESGHYWNLGRMGDGDSAVLSFPRLKKLRSKGILSLMVVQKHILCAVPSSYQSSFTICRVEICSRTVGRGLRPCAFRFCQGRRCPNCSPMQNTFNTFHFPPTPVPYRTKEVVGMMHSAPSSSMAIANRQQTLATTSPHSQISSIWE